MRNMTRLMRGILDYFYEAESITRGRHYFDLLLIPTGIELWAGRRHLILEPLLLRSKRTGKGPSWGASSAA